VVLQQARSISASKGVQDRRSAKPEFRPDIEGLRAVAVLAVVLFHADTPGVGGGYIGVDLFFVISGFLITGLLWREASPTGTIRLRSFYGARARRLLPASAAVGVVIAIASVLLLPSALQARSVLGDGIASALYVSNYWFLLQGVDYLAPVMPPSPYEHYWSLGVEEQFYLVWPTMILGIAWAIRRVRRRTRAQATSSPRPYVIVLALVAVVSFALSLAITYVVPSVAFFSLPTRAWQLAAGGLVALTASRWRRLPTASAAIVGWAGLVVILLGCTLLNRNTLYPGTAALVPVLGAVLVIGAGCASPLVGCGRVLASSPMQAIGRVSYSWYLWHWPLLLLTPLLLGHPLGLAGRLTTAFVALGLAVLTLHLIENPLRFAAPIRRSPMASLLLGGGVTAVAGGVCVTLLAFVPVSVGRGAPAAPLTVTTTGPPGSSTNADDAAIQHAFEQVHTAVSAALLPRAVPSNLQPSLANAADELKALFLGGCMRAGTQGGQPECATGDTASPTTVALVGDSHAAMWSPAFQRVAEQRRWRLETLTKTACPVLDLPDPNTVRRLVSQCDQWRNQVLARLRAEHPQLVVVSMWRGYIAGHGGIVPGFTAYDAAWIDSLIRLVHDLRATGANVLVLGPVPDPHESVPICVSAHLDDAAACSQPRALAVNASGIAAESAATTAAGGRYVDLSDLFCGAERCPVVVGNTLVYFDWSHLTFEYSRQLAPVLEALADRALAVK